MIPHLGPTLGVLVGPSNRRRSLGRWRLASLKPLPTSEEIRGHDLGSSRRRRRDGGVIDRLRHRPRIMQHPSTHTP